MKDRWNFGIKIDNKSRESIDQGNQINHPNKVNWSRKTNEIK